MTRTGKIEREGAEEGGGSEFGDENDGVLRSPDLWSPVPPTLPDTVLMPFFESGCVDCVDCVDFKRVYNTCAI